MLPDLGIEQVKAKVDTGARTSTIHAFELETFEKHGEIWVRFAVHPVQRSSEQVVYCEAEVKDQRVVRDSGGHEEERFVIETNVRIGVDEWPIEITLTPRDNMGFRMLLGRTAIRGHFLVDPGRSYLVGKRARLRRQKGKASEQLDSIPGTA